MAIGDMLARAQALHRGGQAEAARALYLQIVQHAPGAAPALLGPALLGLGVLALQARDPAGALPWLEQARDANPKDAAPWFNLGLAQGMLGRHDLAEAAFTAATRLAPDWPEAQYDLGNARRHLGDRAGAQKAYRQALRLRPGYVQAEVNLANLLQEEGRFDQALAAYRRALARAPGQPQIHTNIGALLLAQEDRPGAAEAFRRALAVAPDFAPALVNLARLLREGGSDEDMAEATRVLTAALAATAPALAAGGNPDLRLRHAEALAMLGRGAEAVPLLRAAVAADPAAVDARLALADALMLSGDPVAALDALPPAPEGFPLVRHARSAAPALRDCGRLTEAEALLRAALRQAPRDTPLTHTLATVLLAQGKYLEGFQKFEARLRLRPRPPPACQAWEGGAPADRHLLILAEEGFGDVIHFLRSLPRLIATGARITLAAPPALHRLVGWQGWEVSLAPPGPPFPPADRYAMLMSLPRLFGEAHPTAANAPYLRVPEPSVQAWRGWLPPAARPVGLVWSGRPSFALDFIRSCPPEALAALARVPDTAWISLHPAPAAPPPGLALIEPAARLSDFAETAALIMALDAVVTVDTAVAHLAGALGKPVLLLNRYGGDWRWWPTPEPPWYPSVTVCAQPAPGDWEGAVARARKALAASD